MEKYSGRCKCEKITFKIKGEPTWKVNCNCNWCQTTSGGAFRSFVLFNEEDIEYQGEMPTFYKDTKKYQFLNFLKSAFKQKIPKNELFGRQVRLHRCW